MKHGHGKRALKITGMVLVGITVAVVFALVFGLAVQYLWNYIMPDLFGLKAITYLQAFALVILAKIFFGSFGPHGGHHHGGGGPWHRWGRACGRPDISREHLRHYESFWRDEGRKAFDEYVKRVDSEGDK